LGRWGGVISDAPDEACEVQYSAIEEKPGLWRITPKEELKPGEYGLFWWAGSSPLINRTGASPMSLYDFGVEK
jgi:hypothetical protein